MTINSIIGLGNPGTKYRGTRHNLGYELLDSFCEEEGISLNVTPRNYAIGRLTLHHLNRKKIHIVKPLTLINLSGSPIKRYLDYQDKDPTEILVLVDDVDLPLGKIRIRKSGSSGGHNGLQSVLDVLETNEFPRLRMGIGQPQENIPMKDYVLSKFKGEENEEKEKMIDTAIEAIYCVLEKDIKESMDKFN